MKKLLLKTQVIVVIIFFLLGQLVLNRSWDMMLLLWNETSNTKGGELSENENSFYKPNLLQKQSLKPFLKTNRAKGSENNKMEKKIFKGWDKYIWDEVLRMETSTTKMN